MNPNLTSKALAMPLLQTIFWRAALFAAMLLAPFAAASEFNFSDGDNWLAEEEEFLKVDEAFVIAAHLADDGALNVRWDMPDGYYLYRHQFAFKVQDPQQLALGEAQIPRGKKKVDDFFGEVEVYYHDVEIVVPLQSNPGVNTQIGVTYQGCADAGLCYPPETKWFAYDGVRLISAQLPLAAAGMDAAGELAEQQDTAAGASANVGVADTQEQLLAGILANESLLYALGLFFIAGIGLAFTPCVLPMVPILSSIIVGEGENISKRKAFTLSSAYVLGMAATYAAVGTLVGLFGAELNLQAALQSRRFWYFLRWSLYCCRCPCLVSMNCGCRRRCRTSSIPWGSSNRAVNMPVCCSWGRCPVWSYHLAYRPPWLAH